MKPSQDLWGSAVHVLYNYYELHIGQCANHQAKNKNREDVGTRLVYTTGSTIVVISSQKINLSFSALLFIHTIVVAGKPPLHWSGLAVIPA